MSFEDDIKGQNTQLYPVVKIGEDYYSTNNTTIKEQNGAGSSVTKYCKPILMNIPSIKESVDVESRKFKISNVSLQFNNFPFEGVRFSDQLSETSLINTDVKIFFKSQSTDNHNLVDAFHTNTGKQMQLVYQGIIRRLSHDDEKVRVELEDLTEQKAHKDLPQAIDQNGVVGVLGSGDDILDKYKNKPIPMVYGEVDRSPAVIGFSSSGHKLLFDSKPYSRLNSENTLFVNSDGHYLNIFEKLSYNDSDLFDDLDKGDNWEDPQKEDIQYEIFDDYVLLNVKTGNGDGIAPSILFNTLLCHYASPASSWSIIGLTVGSGNTNGSVSPTGDLLFPEDFPEYAVDSNSDTICSIPPINTEVTWSPSVLENEGYQTLRMTNAITSLVINASVPSNERFQVNYVEINGVKINYFDAISQSSPESSRWLVDTADDELDLVGEGLGTTNLDETNDFAVNMASLFDINDNSSAPIKIQTYGATEVLKINKVGADNTSISFYLFGWRTNAQLGNNVDAAIYGNFNDIKVAAYVYPDRVLSNNFYANIKGRINTFDDHPQLQVGSVDYFQENSEQVADFLYSSLFNEAPQDIQEYATAYPNLNTTDSAVLMSYIDQLHEIDFIQNPIDIIYDLIRSEIGHENIDEAEYAEAKLAHADWKFGFTINKKISSKKLIEDIAKSTKCFPKFKNDGSFGFNTIKDSYTYEGVDSDYAGATPIKESEVISYSFKKTKPEQIYKKVTVSYNKDYAQDSYLKTTDPEVYDLGADSYYGIEDSADAHLEFESDYIRNGETADLLASFLSEQYKNDHLMFSLKLPLQYIDLEIGDLVKFESLFQGVKAYGIDYTKLFPVNLQTRYPLFMVTSTTKNLDSVSIECMQLHALGNVDNSDWDDFEIEPQDTTAPVITFGSASLTYTVGDAFVPFTATAVDDTDGDITDRITVSYSNDIPINAEASGTYDVPNSSFIVGFSVSDDAGNEAQEVIFVEVSAAPEEEGEFFSFTGFVVQTTQSWVRIGVPASIETGSLENIIPQSPYYKINVSSQGQRLTYVPVDQYNIDDPFVEVTHFYFGTDSETPNVFILYHKQINTLGNLTSNSGYWQFENGDLLSADDIIDVELETYDPAIGGYISGSGDANQDGGLNILDVVIMINFILSPQVDPTGELTDIMDINDDSIVNILDIVQLVNLILD